MATVTEQFNLMNGQIHFRPKITRLQVLDLAVRLKEEAGDKMKLTAVRQCGTNRFGIIFALEYDSTKREYDEIIDAATDKLKREFGNDVSWDITSSCTIIK